MTPSGTHPLGKGPSGTYPSTTDSSHTSPSLAHELNESELQALADSQEAEVLLFQYVVTSAGQLETPLVILKKLANNLGDPQRLPATKILQTAVEHPLAHPLGTLIAMEGILENTFEDSAASFEQELASSLQNDHSTPWISLETGDRAKGIDDDDVMPQTPLADASLQAKPLVERKKHKIFPVGKIFFIGLAMIYGFMVLKTGELSPFGIVANIKNQRAARVQTEQPEQAESSGAPLHLLERGEDGESEVSSEPYTATGAEKNLDQESASSPSTPPSSQGPSRFQAPFQSPVQPADPFTRSAQSKSGTRKIMDKGEGRANELSSTHNTDIQVPPPYPLGKQSALRQSPHPGVVSLPGEIPEATEVNEAKD